MGPEPADSHGYVQDIAPVQPPGERRQPGWVVLLLIVMVVGWLAIRQWAPSDDPGTTFAPFSPSPTGATATPVSDATPADRTGEPPDATQPPVATLTGTWRQTSPAPIAGRTGHVLVWTGTEVLVWGGTASTRWGWWLPRDGAAYNPASDTWRLIPDAPISGRDRPLAAWSGSQLIVWGGIRPAGLPDEPTLPGGRPVGPEGPMPLADGAAYDPATNSWRRVPPSPLNPGDAVGGWLDGALYVVTSDGAARYRPSEDAWTVLGSAPVRQGGRIGVIVAGELLVIAFGDGSGGLVEGAILHPETDTWTDFQPPFVTSNAGLTFVAAGDRVLVPEPRFRSRTLFLRGGLVMERESWRAAEPCPGAARGPAWTGRYVIGVDAAYDMDADWCLALPPAPPRAAPFDGDNGRIDPVGAWTGTEYVTWSGPPSGGYAWVPNDGAVFRPEA